MGHKLKSTWAERKKSPTEAASLFRGADLADGKLCQSNGIGDASSVEIEHFLRHKNANRIASVYQTELENGVPERYLQDMILFGRKLDVCEQSRDRHSRAPCLHRAGAQSVSRSPKVATFRAVMEPNVAGCARFGNELHANLPDDVGKEGQETLSRLKPLGGQEFEGKFMQAQIKDHSDDIQKYSSETSATQNQRVRQFASETIPILQQHLALARTVGAQIENQTTGNAKDK